MLEVAIRSSGVRWFAAGAGSLALFAGIVSYSALEQPAEAAPAPASTPTGPTPEVQAQVFRKGEAGFVVTEIAYVLGPDAKDSGACPAGLTGGLRGLTEAYARTPAGQRREKETQQAYEQRLSIAVNTAPNGQNICMNPEASVPDPGWRYVSGRDITVDGIDLDGQNSVAGGKVAPGTCSHEDFRGSRGETGIDNQFYRMIGCTTGFQSTGQGNTFRTGMYTGSWGILVALRKVDDLRNDDDVEVSLFANGDPIQLSAARDALPFATYAVHRDPRFRATTRGRIVDGVLTTDPVDFGFPNDVNGMTFERVIRRARLKMTFTADGGMEGFLAGYTPVETLYNYQFGARDARNAKGELAPARARIGTSVGRAGALGYSCNGAYFALYQAADGDRDPATGGCTSISTQYRIRVMPAFIVDAPSGSANKALVTR